MTDNEQAAVTLIDEWMGENLKADRTIFQFDEVQDLVLDLRNLLTPPVSPPQQAEVPDDIDADEAAA